MHKTTRRLCCLIIYCVFGSCVAATKNQQPSPLIVKYAKGEQTSLIYQKQNQYFFEMFKLALAKSGQPHQIQLIAIPTMPQSRSILLLQQGHYDVHWMTTNPEREAILLPIRIPLFKGLIGMRLMFIHQDNPNLFAHLTQVEQLKSYIAGQGRDWPDSKLLQQQGFRMIEATNASGLIKMLSLQRIEYFPRSILEVWHEKNIAENDPIIVDEHIVLRYPSAVYYFVAKDNQKLQELVTIGLNNAIADGSFDTLFNQFVQDDISRSKLDERKIFTITNPYMSAETPINQPQYWYQTPTAVDE